jgi:predicted dehydrogenase
MVGFPESLPAARTPDPRAAPTLRWGVIGTGWIAERFVASLQAHSSQQVVAVGSRSPAGAARFGARFGLRRTYGSYAELIADRDVDVVYLAVPHNHHHELALESLAAGKATLVEKPLSLNASQAGEIAEVADRRGLFCMEALWTSFLPKFDVIRQLLEHGVLGEVRSVVADFGEWFSPDHRIMSPELAGGPLLDLGTYLVSFAVNVLGPPARVIASGQFAQTGVNTQTSMVLATDRHDQAALHTTILSNTPTTAVVAGTRATLVVDGPFYQPGGFTVETADRRGRLRYDEPRIAHEGLHYQAAEVARRIHAGETGSPLRPLAASIETLRVIDEVRRQIGLRFVAER